MPSVRVLILILGITFRISVPDGIFIETETPLFVNQELTTTFFLPGFNAPVKVKGKVVRSDSKGIAIEFDEILAHI